MRDDMRHVIHDNRGASKDPYYSRRKAPKDATKEGMGSPDGWRGTRNGPLRRQISKHVGRQWDEVFSELCESNDVRSGRGRRLLKQIEHIVVTKTHYGEDGKIYSSEPQWRWGGNCPIDEGSRRCALYVDPKGFLRSVKPKSDDGQTWYQKSKELHEHVRVIDGNYYGRLDNGSWFELIMKKHDDLTPYMRYVRGNDSMFSDQFFKKQMTGWDLRKAYQANIWCADKRQLSKKEIKKLGLK